MAGFGGSIKLTGESEYKRALQQITQGLRDVSSQMNVVNSSYDKNDKSVSTLASKEEALNKVLEQQKGILAQATSSYNSFREKVEEQGRKHDELKQKYEGAKAKLEEIGKTLGTTSQEYKDQQEEVTKLALEVDKSTKNYDDNQIALSKLRTTMNNAQTTVNNTEQAINDLGNETEESGKQAEKSSQGFTVFKGVLANLTTQAINGAINGLKKLGQAFFNLGKQSIGNFAEYEQLVGGVETLFGDSADKLMEYSAVAYKTAGVSSNQYMQQVTSFSASLLQSLGGDTEKAVEYSNRALIDMSDNANKMGTDMGAIQNAYQGFAKQNYTMLDNLKLGRQYTIAQYKPCEIGETLLQIA